MAGYCDFDQQPLGHFRCKVCGRQSKIRTIAKCRGNGRRDVPQTVMPEDIPCPYRGNLLRIVENKRCMGLKFEPVYACSEFGEATIRSLRGIKSCLRCPLLPPRKAATK